MSMHAPGVTLERLDEEIYLISSEEPGESVATIAGTHADEPAGLEVVNRLKDHEELQEMVASGEFRLDRGQLVVMVGNLAVLNADWGDEPVPHEWHVNMNRMYMRDDDPNAHLMADLVRDSSDGRMTLQEAYEYQRTRVMLPYLDEVNGSPVIAANDLHMHYEKGVSPFIITERHGLSVAQRIGAPIIAFNFAKTEPGGSDYYMNTKPNGEVGICHELGYNGADPRYRTAATRLAHASVSRFLIANGLRDDDPDNPLPPLVKKEDTLYVETIPNSVIWTDGSGQDRLDPRLKTFQPLREGQVIGRKADGEDIVVPEKDMIAIFPAFDPPAGKRSELISYGRRVDAA